MFCDRFRTRTETPEKPPHGVADRSQDGVDAPVAVRCGDQVDLDLALVSAARSPPVVRAGRADRAGHLATFDRRANALLEGLDDLACRVNRRTDRELEVDVDEAFVRLRHELAADRIAEEEACRQNDRRGGDDESWNRDDTPDEARVPALQATEHPRRARAQAQALSVSRLADHPRGQAGHHRERHHQRAGQRETDDGRHLSEEDGREAAKKDDRGKDGNRRQGASDDGRAHFSRALDRCGGAGPAFLALPVDVFEDHDGVVDQHAQAQRQAAEGHDVQGVAGEIHEPEGRDDAEGNGDGDQQGRTDALQKEKEHEHRQQPAPERPGLNVRDRRLDEGSRLRQHDEAQAALIVAVDTCDLVAQRAHHGDRIGTRLLGRAQGDAGVAVHPVLAADALYRVLQIAEVADEDRAAITLGDDDIRHLVGLAPLTDGADQDFAARVAHVACRNVAIVPPERLHDRIRADPEGGHATRVQLDAQLAHLTATHVHRGHARDTLEPPYQDLFGQVAQPSRVTRSAEPQGRNRCARQVELVDEGGLGILG